MSPNFYYDQEDFLRRRQTGKSWSWTALRPEAIVRYATGNPMNLGVAIAVYATISKELGLPLRFPGTPDAYDALYQVTDAGLLAEATVWAGDEPKASNVIFNLTNGDQFRWRHMWPRIARMFDMEVAEPVPMPLTAYMTDKAELWARIVEKHDLQPTAYDRLATWSFADFIFSSGYDNVSSTIKARLAGFHGCVDSEDLFRTFFASLREDRVIP